MITNYYTLLKIDPASDLNTIKKAFRREIAIYHPDNNKSPEAKAHFEKLVEAFEILSNPEKRRNYNNLLQQDITNKPVVIEQKEQYQDWQKEAKTKSDKYRESSLIELLLLDIFVGIPIDGIIAGADALLDNSDSLLEGLGDTLGDVIGGIFDGL